ncbi:unnamed protein product [Albugo candida]|uniref:Metalloendopeptidase n=1 Tax=Albugo candida TaxID=65357 RepID=A0A024FZX0_9STRA|nr:unnamed protein product [Albugo candida]|eukprot:CCI39615.1 unnamed protein product [Albugo candida]
MAMSTPGCRSFCLLMLFVCLRGLHAEGESPNIGENYHCRIGSHLMQNYNIKTYAPEEFVTCRNRVLTCVQKRSFESHGKAIECPNNLHELLNKTSSNSERRKLSLATRSPANIWPHGVACYQFSQQLLFNDFQRQQIIKAMKMIESPTAVRFLPRDGCKNEPVDYCNKCRDYIELRRPQSGRDCNSVVGYNKGLGVHVMNLSDRCFEEALPMRAAYGTALHELGHSLKMLHELQHPLRTVLFFLDKIKPEMWPDLVKDYQSIGGPFDLLSVQMYPASQGVCVRKRDCKPNEDMKAGNCLNPKEKICGINDTNCRPAKEEDCDKTKTESLGQRVRLSPGDLNIIRQLYNFPAAWKLEKSKVK